MSKDIKIGRQDILVVDDMLPNRKILERIINGMGHNPILAGSGEEAIRILKEGTVPGIFLLDISMPDMDGFDLCRIIKTDVHMRDIPVIFISAFSGIEDVVKGFELGGVDYICKPFVPAEVSVRITNHLRMFVMQKEMEVYSQRLNKLVDEQAKKLEYEKRKILYALVKLNERINKYKIANTENEQYNCRMLAQGMQLSTKYEQIISNTFIENIGVAAPLRNIGMIAIPKDIIEGYYDRTLTPEETAQYRKHTTIGAEIIMEMEPDYANNEFCGMVIDMARCHHENWDGSGYPAGLKGEEIPLSARVVRIVESAEGYISGRGMTPEEAIDTMAAYSGIKYDPDIFELYTKIRKRFKF